MLDYIFYGGGSKQWSTLYHNGPLFPELYKPHKIPIIINDIEIILPELAEEYATMYARYLNTPYIENKRFNNNFWKDFKKVLPKNTYQIQSIKDIDFSLIHNFLIKKKESITKEDKQKFKEAQDIYEEPYKYCIIDGIKQNIGNYKIEPPCIFIGRGEHPKLGRIKTRVMPEDVIINISKDASIPKPNLDNHKWKKVIHNKEVIWLASWKENITNKIKYIFTSLDSIFKSKSDEEKFNLARKLKKKITYIRDSYEQDLSHSNMKIKQLATALYFIDHLALRVGGGKSSKETVDTVGATTLKIENIKLLDDLMIKLDFLGKDVIRYCKKIKVSNVVYNNLQIFIADKDKKSLLFDLINATALNEYLISYMPNLTAKVWRTYNASYLFQKELDKIKITDNIASTEQINYLITMFNNANLSVGLLCNHQKKSLSKNNLNKYTDKIKKIKTSKKMSKKEMKTKIKLLKLKKKLYINTRTVSLDTSKNNYIDPRIIFSFIKKYNIPPDKIFSKKLINRFKWADDITDEHFRF